MLKLMVDRGTVELTLEGDDDIIFPEAALSAHAVVDCIARKYPEEAEKVRIEMLRLLLKNRPVRMMKSGRGGTGVLQ